MPNHEVKTEDKKSNLEQYKYLIYISSFYIYFSGAMFFYGYMNGFGFEGASLDSIFSPLIYSQELIAIVFSKVFIKISFEAVINSYFILPTVLLSCIFYLTLTNRKTKILKYIKKKKISFNKISSKKIWVNLIIAIPASIIFQLLLIYVVVALSSIILLTLYMPYYLGGSKSKDIIENYTEYCKKIDWESEDFNGSERPISCDKIRIDKDGEFITGIILHSDPKFTYAVTNNLLLRLKDEHVVSCRQKQSNPNHNKDKDIANEKFESCDQIFSVYKTS